MAQTPKPPPQHVANTVFSAGLGPKGRAAAWIAALAGAGIWMYMENKDNGEKFSSTDAKRWNDERKKKNPE